MRALPLLLCLLVLAVPAQAHGGGFDSGPIQPGETRWTTFQAPTELRYEDAHTDATGIVRVVAAEGEPQQHTIAILDDPARFEPSDLTVRAGDKVTWRNNGTQVHSVRAPDPSHVPAQDAYPGADPTADAKGAPAPVPLLAIAFACLAARRWA